MRQADIALCVTSVEEIERRHREAERRASYEPPVANRLGTEIGPLVTPDTLVLLNKIDLASESASRHAKIMEEVSSEVLARGGGDYVAGHDNREWYWSASLATGEGMPEFVEGLVRVIRQRYGLELSEGTNGKGERRSMGEPMIRHARQRVHMENAAEYLEAFVRCVDNDEGRVDVVLGAEELRYAAREIGSISRAVSVDDVLDGVFRDFCIGK